MHDPLSDFLNKLKTASRQGLESFSFPSSRLILAVAGALEKQGYLAVGKKVKKGRQIEMRLSSDAAKRPVTGVRRVSRLSKRAYRPARALFPIRNGFGAAFVSTSKGVLSDTEARAAGTGGEVLFEIW